jgi:hypothetical protein
MSSNSAVTLYSKKDHFEYKGLLPNSVTSKAAA